MIDVRLKNSDVPFMSEDFQNISNTQKVEDMVTKHTVEAISKFPTGTFGKSIAMSLSGAAASVVKGHTIHRALSLPISINRQVLSGELPLPTITSTAQAKLLHNWCSIKVAIIDEVFTISVEFLSLIDERMQQIFFN